MGNFYITWVCHDGGSQVLWTPREERSDLTQGIREDEQGIFFPLQVKQALSQKMDMEEIEVYNYLLVKGQERHSKRFRKGPV